MTTHEHNWVFFNDQMRECRPGCGAIEPWPAIVEPVVNPIAGPQPTSVDGEPRKFRKKAVTVEAMQFDGSRASIEAICAWANAHREGLGEDDDPWVDYVFTAQNDVIDPQCNTLEGPLHISVGDWIIKGVAGEFYPCEPGIFEAWRGGSPARSRHRRCGTEPMTSTESTESQEPIAEDEAAEALFDAIYDLGYYGHIEECGEMSSRTLMDEIRARVEVAKANYRAAVSAAKVDDEAALDTAAKEHAAGPPSGQGFFTDRVGDFKAGAEWAAVSAAKVEAYPFECANCEEEVDGPPLMWRAKTGERIELCDDCHELAFRDLWLVEEAARTTVELAQPSVTIDLRLALAILDREEGLTAEFIRMTWTG